MRRREKGLSTVMRDPRRAPSRRLIDDLEKFFDAVEFEIRFSEGPRVSRRRMSILFPDTITARLVALQARIAEVVKRADTKF